MSDSTRTQKLRTLAIHAGETPDAVTGASAPNIVMSTTFLADAESGFSIESAGDESAFIYTRWANPTVDQLERKLAILEGGEACAAFASGMAAISALFFHLLGAGDHLVMSDVAYAGASELANELLPRLGVEVTKVDMSDLEELQAAITPATRLVYIETPCNPIVRLTDIEAVTQLAHAAGVPVAVDSTFATPVATQPITLGADYVIHSLTKYLCGHGDALGGAIIGRADTIGELRRTITVRTGGVLSPFNAWLILRGIATLPLRMQAHEAGAMQVARFLEAHPKVERVIYPGLASHPQHVLARRQMANFSGMMTLRVADGRRATRILAERLRVFHYAVSLGHQRSLLFYMDTADLLETSFKLSREQEQTFREFAGDGMFRVSIGLEDADDLCADLEYALAAI